MINATIEVRMTSSRLRGKPLMKAAGMTMLEILIQRLSQSRFIDKIIVATTINKEDDPIVDFCKENEICFFRGSEDNVLERVWGAAKKYNTDILVQITGDCPLIDYRLVDELIELFLKKYPSNRVLSNTGPDISMPWGFDVQVYKAKELENILMDSPSIDDKEHVSQRFYLPEFQDLYNTYHLKYQGALNRPEMRVTLDYPEDYTLLKEVIESFGPAHLKDFTAQEIIEWLDMHPSVRDASIQRHNEPR